MADGWKIKVTTIDREGKPAGIRHFLVFEGDVDRAIALLHEDSSVNADEATEAIMPMSQFAFERRGIKRGK
jgi:hypothetical protein